MENKNYYPLRGGKNAGEIVSDTRTTEEGDTRGHSEKEYYGGYLVAESIPSRHLLMQLIDAYNEKYGCTVKGKPCTGGQLCCQSKISHHSWVEQEQALGAPKQPKVEYMDTGKPTLDQQIKVVSDIKQNCEAVRDVSKPDLMRNDAILALGAIIDNLNAIKAKEKHQNFAHSFTEGADTPEPSGITKLIFTNYELPMLPNGYQWTIKHDTGYTYSMKPNSNGKFVLDKQTSAPESAGVRQIPKIEDISLFPEGLPREPAGSVQKNGKEEWTPSLDFQIDWVKSQIEVLNKAEYYENNNLIGMLTPIMDNLVSIKRWREGPVMKDIDCEKVLMDLLNAVNGFCANKETVDLYIQNAEAALGMLQALKEKREKRQEGHVFNVEILEKRKESLEQDALRKTIITIVEEMLKLKGL